MLERVSEEVQELAKREKPEKEETPAKKEEAPKEAGPDEVDKGSYQRARHEAELEEAEETMLTIPKAQWKVVRPLKDMAVTETEEAVFECEFNVPKVNVTWKVNGEEIAQSPKHIIKSEGTVHILIITKCRIPDQGTVSCSYAKLETTAKLTVTGEFLHMNISLIFTYAFREYAIQKCIVLVKSIAVRFF